MNTSRCAVLWIAVALFALPALAGEQVTGFSAGAKDPAVLNAGLPADMYGYHPDDDGSWGESWSIQAHNDEGDFVYVLMSISNYNPFHKFGGTVDLFYYPADGGKHKAHSEFKRDQCTASKDGVNVDIGGHKLTGSHPNYHFTGAFPDLGMDLKFTVETPDLLFGGDRIRFGDEDRYWLLTILAPRARVEGTITVAGKKVPFRGYAYMDHGWSLRKLYKFSSRWYVLRVLQDDLSFNAVQMKFRDGFTPGETSAIYVTKGGRVIANGGGVTLTAAGGSVHERSGVTLPGRYTVDYDDGRVKLAGTVKMVRLGEALNVLDQLSPFVQAVIKGLVTDPWQFRFHGEADLQLTVGGETQPVTGPVVGEVHYYK